MPLSIMFQLFTTSLLQAGGFRRLMFYAPFNIVSVIYHTCAVGRGVWGANTLHSPPENKEALLLAVLVLMLRFQLNIDYQSPDFESIDPPFLLKILATVLVLLMEESGAHKENCSLSCKDVLSTLHQEWESNLNFSADRYM